MKTTKWKKSPLGYYWSVWKGHKFRIKKNELGGWKLYRRLSCEDQLFFIMNFGTLKEAKTYAETHSSI